MISFPPPCRQVHFRGGIRCPLRPSLSPGQVISAWRSSREAAARLRSDTCYCDAMLQRYAARYAAALLRPARRLWCCSPRRCALGLGLGLTEVGRRSGPGPGTEMGGHQGRHGETRTWREPAEPRQSHSSSSATVSGRRALVLVPHHHVLDVVQAFRTCMATFMMQYK